MKTTIIDIDHKAPFTRCKSGLHLVDRCLDYSHKTTKPGFQKINQTKTLKWERGEDYSFT